ncbi:hypothetical protein [Acinetobacter pullicarnis]|uniref:hypothetical protein n=1 Tax=Acinetobacter pullicarnis TaxID=2576829 RepID=UPI0011240F85|nr:hypothetical protein [Acinetobacter pullicarnis]
MNLISIPALYLASVLTLCAALLHYACIFWGAGFRLLGAGESIVKQSEAGHCYPKLMAMAIGSALLLCAVYTYCAASGTAQLPFSKALFLIMATVLLARAMAFPWLKSRFAGNSNTFWYVSSFFCLVLSSLYALGSLSV